MSKSKIGPDHIKELEDGTRWVGATKAAKELGVSRQTVHNLYRDRRLWGIKTDAGLLLDRTDARYEQEKRYAAERRAGTTTPSQPREVRP